MFYNYGMVHTSHYIIKNSDNSSYSHNNTITCIAIPHPMNLLSYNLHIYIARLLPT